jgi:hypothetical protein
VSVTFGIKLVSLIRHAHLMKSYFCFEFCKIKSFILIKLISIEKPESIYFLKLKEFNFAI